MRTSIRSYARAVCCVMEMNWKQTATDAFILFTVIIQPFLVALLGLWMLRDKGPDYGIYVVVGSGMTGLWSSLLFVCGNSINTERFSGTLETLVGVPTPMAVIVFGKNLSNVIQSLLSMVVTYILASLVFGYPLSIASPLAFLLSLVLTVAALIAFGLVLSPVFVINPSVQQWQNGFEFPVYILSGFLFPVLLLPVWTVPVSYALPTYWAAKALHASAKQPGIGGDIAMAWFWLLVSSAVYFSLAAFLFRIMLHKAKKNATLDTE